MVLDRLTIRGIDANPAASCRLRIAQCKLLYYSSIQKLTKSLTLDNCHKIYCLLKYLSGLKSP